MASELPTHITKTDNGYYRVRYRRSVSYPFPYDKTFKTLEEADEANKEYLAKITLKIYNKRTKDNIGFSDFCDFVIDWYRNASRKKAHNTIEFYKTYMKLLKPYFKNKYMRDIDVFEIEMVLAEEKKRPKRGYGVKKGEKITSATLVHVFATLRMIFNKAKRWGFIDYNPILEVEQPKHRAREIEIPAFEEFEHIEAAIMKADIRERCQFLLGLYGGLREEEVSGIHLELINRENNTIKIRYAVVQNELTREFEESDTKSIYGERTIPFPDKFFNVLDEYLHYRQSFVNILKIKTNGEYSELPNLFLNKDGDYYRPSRTNRMWKKFRDQYLPELTISFHGLRHYYISNQMNYNDDLTDREVQELAGHSRITTTYRYVHPNRENLNKNAVKIFEKFSYNSLYKKGNNIISIPISHLATIILGDPSFSKLEELQITLTELFKEEVNFYNLSVFITKCKNKLIEKYPSLTMIEKSNISKMNSNNLLLELKKVFGSEFDVDCNIMIT